MTDTHIHLEFDSYDVDREAVINRFFDQGGQAIITVGTDLGRIEKALAIARRHPRIFVAIGFHPQEATDLALAGAGDDFVDDLRKFLPDKKVVAIGEIGLDYYHPSATDYDLAVNDKIKDVQAGLFKKQLDLAREFQLPVSIHLWDSQADGWEILRNYPDLKIVLHCYGRGLELLFTRELLKQDNVYFSFTGNITFPRTGKAGSEIWEHLKIIPLNRIMVETDGPFLAPAPFRGKRNEPAYVKKIIEKIAEVKNLPIDDVEATTDANAVSFFRLPAEV